MAQIHLLDRASLGLLGRWTAGRIDSRPAGERVSARDARKRPAPARQVERRCGPGAAFLCWILAVIVGAAGGTDSTASAIVAFLFVVGVLLLVIGLIGLVVVKSAYDPTARVMEQQPGQYEPVVELRRVHPNFVNAMRLMQAARAAQYPFQPGSR